MLGVACHEPSGGEVSRMECGYERMEQLLGYVQCKATEPCATANNEVAVPPWQLFCLKHRGLCL